MDKQTALKLFGGTYTTLGEALGISRQAAFQLPNKLTQKHIDRLIGAAVRVHGHVPIELLKVGADKTADN